MRELTLNQVMYNLWNLSGDLSTEETEAYYEFHTGPYFKYRSRARIEDEEDNPEVPRDLVEQLRPVFESMTSLATQRRIRGYDSIQTFEELDELE